MAFIPFSRSASRFLFAAMAIFLVGCAPMPLQVGLTELGTVSNSEYGAYGTRLMRSINISGTGAEDVVGMVSYDLDKWSLSEQLRRLWPIRQDFPDITSPRLIPGSSSIVEREFCKTEKKDSEQKDSKQKDSKQKDSNTHCSDSSNASLGDLTKLRDALLASQAQADEVARLKIKLAVLQLAQASLKPVNALKDGDPEKEEKLNRVLNPLRLLYPADEISKDLEPVIDSVKKELKDNGLGDSLTAIREVTQKAGVIVTRWTGRSQGAANAQGAGMASAAVAASQGVNGYLILGSPRITSLQLGEDFFKRPKDLDLHIFGKSNRRYLTYYQLRARYVLYAENRASEFSASLQTNISQTLEQIKAITQGGKDEEALKNLLNIEVNAVYALVNSSASSGTLDAAQGKAKRIDCKFSSVQEWSDCLKQELVRSEGTLPVISVRATLEEFARDSE
ncbi:hypothetical protein [Hylemonella gracilis]|nr:hypothetical protein [Hylemonella gracilis]